MLDPLTQRLHGIYYTPPLAAQVMARWVIRSHDDRVLEPCFGSGVFLEALQQMPEGKSAQIHGVEIMDLAYGASIGLGLIDADYATKRDFLDVTPFPVDAVIGNPPYVRLRSLPAAQEERASKTTEEVLGTPMDAAGSVWMAFVLHATRFLALGGRFAFVLPYEVTHVRYAKPLWRFLSSNFGSLRVVRVKERLFPDLMQEVVVLFADDRGASTKSVCFEAYETARDLDMGTPGIKKKLSIKSVIEDRPFIRALLSDQLDELLQERIVPLTSKVPEFCTFNIGYVSGNKHFFHPDKQAIEHLTLPRTSLRNTVVASRDLSGIGIHSSSIKPANLRKLFYPNGSLSAAEWEYILQGERYGVNSGYKCRNRTPWYRVPDVRVPDLLLSVFKEVPALISNDGDLVASNSILCGFVHHPYTVEQLLAAWYTSLTLLSCELQVHSLGGGVLVLIPGEVAKVRIPRPASLPLTHLDELDRALAANDDPYQIGDSSVLAGSLRLSPKEIELIQEGAALLAEWRKSHRGQYRVQK